MRPQARRAEWTSEVHRCRRHPGRRRRETQVETRAKSRQLRLCRRIRTVRMDTRGPGDTNEDAQNRDNLWIEIHPTRNEVARPVWAAWT